MKALLYVIRFIFSPLKTLTRLIYGREAPQLMGYAWYDRSDYEKIRKSAKDGKNMLLYKEWKELAEEAVGSFRRAGWFVVKVRVRHYEFRKWLKAEKLVNISETRELFISTKFAPFMEDPTL